MRWPPCAPSEETSPRTGLVLGAHRTGVTIAAATHIIAVDPIAVRRDAALALGATDVIDPGPADVVHRTRDLVPHGVDCAFVAVSGARHISTAVSAVRRGGTAVCIGGLDESESIVIDGGMMFAGGEKRLIGCLLGSGPPQRSIPRLLELWRIGRLNLQRLVTSRLPLASLHEGIAAARAGAGDTHGHRYLARVPLARDATGGAAAPPRRQREAGRRPRDASAPRPVRSAGAAISCWWS